MNHDEFWQAKGRTAYADGKRARYVRIIAAEYGAEAGEEWLRGYRAAEKGTT